MRSLVDISTDGNVAFVQLPGGQKLNLGPVSALDFVRKLALSTSFARRALDEFLKSGSAMLSVDIDQMWEVLAPRRSRWAASPLIRTLGCGSTTGERRMPNLKEIGSKLATVEQTMAAVQVEAANGEVSADKRKAFTDALAGLCESAQGQGCPDLVETNTLTATDILQKVQATGQKIDELVTAGRKFNASKAREDLYTVTSTLNDVLLENKLSDATDRLAQLDQEASRIHGLFFPPEK